MTRPENTPALEAEQSESGAVRRSGPDPEKVFHGGPCKNCGSTLRWRRGGECVSCARRRGAEWGRENYRRNPEPHREAARQYREARRDDPAWRAKQAEHARESRRKKATDPEWVAQRREYQREWERKKRATDPTWVAKQADRKREAARARRANDPEWAERERERKRQKYANNPEYAEYRRQESLERYYALDHIAYNEMLLKSRRRKALKRKEARHSGSLSDEG